MIKWSVSTEVFSLILLFILILNFHERRWSEFPQRKLYRLCLYLSAGTIVLNVLCTYLISLAASIPLWINVACNSAYFLLIVAISSIIAYYMCRLLYEHVYQCDGMRRYRRLLITLYGLYVLLIIWNIPTGVVFYFDAQYNYQRGPLITAGYVVMLLQLLALLIVAARNWRSISISMRKVMRILPPTILALTAYQMVYPDVLLNGGIIAAANLILLVNFQSRRIEQDILTPSGNRGSLLQELLLRIGGRQPFQILAISLQQYRIINQRYGTKRGDALLYDISLWLERLHPKGRSFRIGNMEFALLVPYDGADCADQLVRQVYERFQKPWCLDTVSITPGAVFAEFIYTGEDERADDVLELLNFSLTLAKSRTEHLLRFDPSIYQKMARQSQTINLLQRATRENLLETWYQPIYNCRTGRFSMAEALVRMRDTQGRLISPALFIPVAEANGFIVEITDVVLEQVCRLLATPTANSLESVSVNLSAQQLLSEDLVGKLDALQARYHFDPKRLHLEVTERVLSENPQKMQDIMAKLIRRGIRFALDDFGTGQSNLSLILENSFSFIKLDHSLIQEYPESKRSSFVVNTMLDMFHNMDCQLIVEGVEREAQAQALMEHGVQWIQGFYYAKPMETNALLTLLGTASGVAGSIPL